MASESPEKQLLSLRAFGATHAGRARSKNEDSFYCDPSQGLFGVIDGMGGHAAGEEASRIACDEIVTALFKLQGESELRLCEAITRANNEIHRVAREKPNWKSMACVLTFAVVDGKSVVVGHVGDTRLYRIREGEIQRITTDHSAVGELEDRCIVTELEAMQHPRRNEVLRDVGTKERTRDQSDFIDIYRFNVQEGDAILLCTDGLSDMLTARQIQELTQSRRKPKEVVDELISAANAAGGKDNVTVVYAVFHRDLSALITKRDYDSRPDRTDMATIYKHANGREQSRKWKAVARARWGEFLGLTLASLVVVFGLFLVYQAKTTNPEQSPFYQADDQLRNAEPVNLNKATVAKLMSVLTAFENNADRRFAAEKILDFVTQNNRDLYSVSSLSRITIERKEIDTNANLDAFKARLATVREDEKQNPPEKPDQPIKLFPDFSQFKPLFVVRTPSEFRSDFIIWCGVVILIFYTIHILWRTRDFRGDEFLLPIVHLLSGLGLILMITLRDPFRDSLAFKDFAIGLLIGGAVLVIASLANFQRLTSKVVWKPLLAAISLSVLLLVFGKGPGASDAKVNLWIFQPAEFIKILIVFFLAAYFAENWEYLRELKDKGNGLLALLRRSRAPRLAEILPVSIAIAASLAFFFLQKDLGPALIIGLTFVSLYAVARYRFKAALFGLILLAAGIWISYKTATPLVVYQRIRIWLDAWDNGLRNGDQIAQAWWAMAMGRYTGTGLGLGNPSLIPAGHTDLVLASFGEELGLAGVATILVLYVLLVGRSLRIALRSQSDYGFFLALGLTLVVAFEIVLITSGVLGLFPLSGVVSPFLSFGKSSMIANCALVGVLLSVSTRTKSKETHGTRFGFPVKVISFALFTVALALVAKAAYVQVWKSDENAIAPVLTEQRDNQYRYVYNPRLTDALRLLPQGSVYDRNGVPLATSDWSELENHRKDYEKLGINIDVACNRKDKRFYPFGTTLFHFLGDGRTKENWSASNSAYLERDYAWRLRGFNDHIEKIQKRVFEIDHATKQIQPREVEVLRHDYSDVLPLLRYRNRPSQSDYQELLQRERNVRTSIDAGLQLKASEVLAEQLKKQNLQKGAVVLMDASTGEVLAMVSFPLPSDSTKVPTPVGVNNLEQTEDQRAQFLNRALFGLYPPGSTFKIVTAIAALRKDPSLTNAQHECKPLGEGRVGNYVNGWARPVRDAEEDHAHGTISMEEAIVHSCNAYFGQFAAYDVGAFELLGTANLFEINVAQPNTAIKLDDSLPWSAFGQGQVVASPFEMSRVAATIANGGLMPYGKWVTDDSNQRDKGDQALLNQSQSAIIARAMRAVVERGTAANLRSVTPPISGKTGTAEVENKPPHSWFIGFAPVGNRRLAFAVVVENGGFGKASAAPVAGEIIKAAKPY